jgi:hypothetical protein
VIARQAVAGTGGRAAARQAVRAALAPTVGALQDSVFDLLNRLLPTVALSVPVMSERPDGRALAADRVS